MFSFLLISSSSYRKPRICAVDYILIIPDVPSLNIREEPIGTVLTFHP